MDSPYEPQGIFCGGAFTLKEVQDILSKAKAVFTKDGGAQMIQWGDHGASAINRLALTADQVILECRMALQELAPETYPGDADRTTVGFH
jgi:hypothetical protein